MVLIPRHFAGEVVPEAQATVAPGAHRWPALSAAVALGAAGLYGAAIGGLSAGSARGAATGALLAAGVSGLATGVTSMYEASVAVGISSLAIGAGAFAWGAARAYEQLR